MDVKAFDPLYKLVILVVHAFGVIVQPDEVFNFGIHTLNDQDIQYCKEKDYKIKVVPQAHKISNNSINLSSV